MKLKISINNHVFKKDTSRDNQSHVLSLVTVLHIAESTNQREDATAHVSSPNRYN